MRSAVALLAVSFLLPAFATIGDAADPYETLDDGARTLVPPTNGTFLGGASGARLSGTDLDPSPEVVAVTHHSWQGHVTDCHRRLYADLAWHPTSATEDPDAAVDLPYLFEIGVEMDGATHLRRVPEPKDRIYLGEPVEDGNLTIHLVLRQGAAVHWTFSVSAHQGPQSCPVPL